MKDQILTMEQKKIDLMNEKIEVDQALFQQEKKNFKRKLHAVKLTMKQSQQELAKKERQRQLDWLTIQKDMETKYQDQLLQQQQQYELTLLATEQGQEQVLQQYQHQVQELQAQLLLEQQQQTTKEEPPLLHDDDATRSAPNEPQLPSDDKIQELLRTIEDQQIQLNSYEMQLLELERDHDLRGSGGNLTSPDATAAMTTLDRQLSDAKLQIDTLLHRQSVSDQKLIQEPF